MVAGDGRAPAADIRAPHQPAGIGNGEEVRPARGVVEMVVGGHVAAPVDADMFGCGGEAVIGSFECRALAIDLQGRMTRAGIGTHELSDDELVEIDILADIKHLFRRRVGHAVIRHDDDRRRVRKSSRPDARNELAHEGVNFSDGGFCFGRTGTGIVGDGVDPVEIDGGEARTFGVRHVIPGKHFVDAFLVGLLVLVGRPDGRTDAFMGHF